MKMQIQTAERQELQRVIDMLPDNSIMTVLNLIKSLQMNDDDGYSPHIPNIETAAAIRDGRAGKVKSFSSIEALLADLRNDNDD
jgi:hypothetical protein